MAAHNLTEGDKEKTRTLENFLQNQMVSSAKMLVQSMGSLQRRVLTTGTTNTSNKFLSFSRHISISSQVLRSLKGRYQGNISHWIILVGSGLEVQEIFE